MAYLNEQKIHDGMINTTWRGVAIQKFPLDVFMYQMIIHEIRPDLIIEIGSMHGGSAIYFADLLELFGIEGGEVHSIDIGTPRERSEFEVGHPDHRPNPKEVKNYVEVGEAHPRIKWFSGGYQVYDLANAKGFKTVLFIDDGSHVYEDVMAAMNKFKDLVSVGSYMIIEDGNAYEVASEKVKGELNGGPLKATLEFLGGNDNFRVDYRWCDMFGINSTFNTYGYLQKIK